MKLWRVLWLVPILVTLGVLATPVYADTPNPDSAPTVERIRIYRNLLETGDFCMVFEANIPYTTLPDTPVTQTFIWRLIDTDGVTLLGSTVGYAYNDDGYGYNVYSMYFDAADAPTWGQAYGLKLTGNPAVFDDPPIYNFTVSASDYTALTGSEENQAALATEVLYLAGDLNVRWGLDTDYRLTLETETGTVLSIYGEDVMRGCIYGVQALAPAAFRFVIKDIGITDRSWNGSYITDLDTQWSGSWVEVAKNASRDLLGTDYDLLSLGILMMVCVGLIIINLSLTGDHWNGLIDVAFILVIAARLGIYGLAYLGLIAALCIFFIGTRLWRMIPT